MILFYAETLFAFGKWVGIELDAPLAPGSEIFAGRDFRQLDEDGGAFGAEWISVPGSVSLCSSLWWWGWRGGGADARSFPSLFLVFDR